MATVRKKPTTKDVVDAVIETVSNEPTALRLWMFSHRGGDLDFWVLTPPLDMDAERPYDDLIAALYDRFPELDVDVQIHVMNPRLFSIPDVSVLVPGHAKVVPLPRR